MPDENSGQTDWSDVLIAYSKSKFFWGAVALFLIVLSGWASPDNVTDLVERTLQAWRCNCS